MTPEQSLWDKLRRGLSPYLRLQRLEDRYSSGVADVLYAGPIADDAHRAFCGGLFGVIELKVLKAWPKRKTTIVRVPKWTTVQRAWCHLFGKVAQHVFLLLKVEKDILLYHWPAALEVGTLTKDEMLARTPWRWVGRPDYAQLAQILTDPAPHVWAAENNAGI